MSREFAPFRTAKGSSLLRRRVAEPADAAEVVSDLEEIHEQMTELLRQAERLVRSVGDRQIEARAEGYWMAHMKEALGGMGYRTHATTLEDTIGEIANLAYGDDDEEEEEPVFMRRSDD